MTESITYDTLNTLPLWQGMATITLEDMRSVKLMNRIDTKYVLTTEDVISLLEQASAMCFRVQIIGDIRAARYDTLYYDTPERAMYVTHHNQILTRQKIRTRHYVDNDATFLEIKDKSNRGRTDKRRITIALSSFEDIHHDSKAREFLAERSHYGITTLTPALSTRFVRITLVTPTLSERVTIDLCLEYRDVRSGHSAEIRDMAIVEIKQDGNSRSLTKEILRAMRIQPLKVSKYCLGTALTVEGIKKNRMKMKLREIEKRLGYDKVRISTTPQHTDI